MQQSILSTLPVTSRDQANFGKTLLFSFILGLGDEIELGGLNILYMISLTLIWTKKGGFNKIGVITICY